MAPKILIADDDDDTLQLMCMLLCRNDAYSCDEARDGRQAWEMYLEARHGDTPYVVVLLDAAMPYMTGFEVCKRIRESGDLITPVLIITAHPNPLDDAHKNHVQAEDVWYKPFEPLALQDRVTELLQKRGILPVEYEQLKQAGAGF